MNAARRIAFPLLVIILTMSIDSKAQQPVMLSLKRAVDAAVDQNGNTRVQLANEMVRQFEAKAAQARATLLPDISASVGQQQQTRSLAAAGLVENLPAGIELPAVTSPFNTFDARGVVAQKIFDLSSIRRYQSAQSEVRALKFDSDAVKEDIAGAVAKAYLNALRMQAIVESAQADAALSESLLDLAKNRKEAGTATGIEVTRAEVELANDNQSLLVAKNNFVSARLQLLRAIGFDLDAEIELTDQLSFSPLDPVSVEQAVAAARESLPDLKAQHMREETARLNHSSVALERLPSIVAFADYGVIGFQASESRPTRTVGVSVKLPIFDGGRRDARRSETLSALRQEQIRTADFNDEIELRIRLALDAVQSAADQVAAAENGLALSSTELEQAKRRYEAGVVTNVEVTDAQARLQRARANRISAVFNHAVARIDLASAMGAIQPLINNWR